MKTLLVNVAGKTHRVHAQKVGSVLWLHLNGETWAIDQRAKGKQREGQREKAGSGLVAAPMPGKILKVNHKVGDRVDAKTVVIIMEAMKMEYSLCGGIEGVVKEINCKVGDQVELNQLLAKIEKVN